MLFRKAFNRIRSGKKTGESINNFRYADDIILIADSVEDLQILMDPVIMICEKYGMTLDSRKRKILVVSKKL